jgi:Type I phosphodiesterase / nucleotide pyrophosphatase
VIGRFIDVTIRGMIALAVAIGCVACDSNGGRVTKPQAGATGPSSGEGASRGTATVSIDRGCALPKKILVRLWRGHDEVSSEDVTVVPRRPNYWGTFGYTSHTGPWDYVQTVPLVLYGPGHVAPAGIVTRPANITDVYPTIGRLLDAELPSRDGEVLEEVFMDTPATPPRLVVVLMWDGGGRNVLERWPQRWPTLARMEHEGTSFLNATVGSSPSITAAIHANLGTGAFPRSHGITAAKNRQPDGTITTAFAEGDPSGLELTTFGDEIDLGLDNDAKVGMVAWQPGTMLHTGTAAWKSDHLGMLGHGSSLDGGDRDQAALLGHSGAITSNPEFYETPAYLREYPGLQERVDELDLSDGEADGEWMGRGILDKHDNPAWAQFETDVLLALLEREGYGQDSVPDLVFANYKMIDLVGHTYTLDSERMAEVVEAHDDALARLVRYLERSVGEYVVVVSADHGHTPSPERTDAWPIQPTEVVADIERHFGIPRKEPLVEETSAAGLFMNEEIMNELDMTSSDVAEFLNGYTIRENYEGDLPEGYENRGDERVMSAAFAKSDFDDVIECAFGSSRPPPDAQG